MPISRPEQTDDEQPTTRCRIDEILGAYIGEREKALDEVVCSRLNRVWFIKNPNMQDCELEKLKGYENIYAIIDHSLHECVGYTNNTSPFCES